LGDKEGPKLTPGQTQQKGLFRGVVAVEERGAPKKKEKWPKENVNRQFRETWKKPKGVIQTVPGP